MRQVWGCLLFHIARIDHQAADVVGKPEGF